MRLGSQRAEAGGRKGRHRRAGRRVGAGWVLGALLAAAAAVQAGRETGHGEVQHHGIPWGTLCFAAINFSVFVWLLLRFAGPGVRQWVGERRQRVIRELEAAAQARAEAERLHAEWRARVDNLEREAAEIRQRARAEAERERDRILQAASAAAQAIDADARRAAEQEVRRAGELLRDEVAREAVAMAERLIRERLTPAHQSRFVNEFAGRVKP